MKKWLLTGLIIVLFISGCTGLVGGGERPEETAGLADFVRSGTEGLRLEFVEGLPPNSIYDTFDLVIVSKLKNLGSYGIDSDQPCFLELSGPDWSIVRGVTHRQSCSGIESKTVFNTEGGFSEIEFKSSSIFLPQGVNKFSPNLVLSACYGYKTIASPQVCIDPNFYQLTSEQKACKVRNVNLGGGQGAPVSVDRVNVKMAGQKAIFEIDISNSGGGRVVSPTTSLNLCPGNMRYDDFDQVRFRISLSGNSPEKCTPGDYLARLTNGKGKMFCTFNIANTAAYETPLQIELNYNYLQSISKKIDIIRTPR